jgi:hypothetical protein
MYIKKLTRRASFTNYFSTKFHLLKAQKKDVPDYQAHPEFLI